MDKKELTIEDILNIVISGTKKDRKDLPGKIKNIAEEYATRAQRDVETKNQDIINKLKGWARNYLNGIKRGLAKAKKGK